MVNEFFEWTLEESRLRAKRMSLDRRRSASRIETEGFRCTNCGANVLRASFLSGVVNRNHCPYCLWTRHVDWQRPGDRMSACKGRMQPVGLALKRNRNKYKYDSGELMVIHACQECSHVSLNRIAADDSAETLLAIFENTSLLTVNVRSRLQIAHITWLTQDKKGLVHSRLFGNSQTENTAPAGAVPFISYGNIVIEHNLELHPTWLRHLIAEIETLSFVINP